MELSSGQYNPEDSSEHHTRRRENLKSHKVIYNPKDGALTCVRNEYFFTSFYSSRNTQVIVIAVHIALSLDDGGNIGLRYFRILISSQDVRTQKINIDVIIPTRILNPALSEQVQCFSSKHTIAYCTLVMYLIS
jgi:hypothetical protein